ncbi:MAG TPA: hypothetical protein VN929_10625 [Burkholderiales bacterium]|nr:hypothetical protein [Burkholderiales bacterium]
MEKLHREASMLRAACLSAALLACAPALAQNYGGTYTARNASGGTVMLTLAQDAQGVSGTLTGYGSSSLQVQARVEAEGLRGTAGNNFGMLYLTGRLNGEELSIVLTESDLGGKPNPRRASELRLAKAQAKTAPHNERLSEALTRNAWCSFTYNISGNRNMERLVFTRSGLVNQTSGKQAHWRVQNETLEFSPDGISWSPQPLRLALSSNGSAVLQSHNKEYAQCD